MLVHRRTQGCRLHADSHLTQRHANYTPRDPMPLIRMQQPKRRAYRLSIRSLEKTIPGVPTFSVPSWNQLRWLSPCATSLRRARSLQSDGCGAELCSLVQMSWLKSP